jgi:hypothetical protein
MENRHGLVVDAELTRASGHAERLAALAMLDRLPTLGPMTLAADRGFDARDFVMELRERRVTPHIAQNTSGRRSAIDGRTTRHPSYGASQRVRKRMQLLADGRVSGAAPAFTDRPKRGAKPRRGVRQARPEARTRRFG